jgi:hypothetical protein
MQYKKVNVELVVVADEAEAMVASLNLSLDRLGERLALFSVEIETTAVERTKASRRSGLARTIAAGELVAAAPKTARESVVVDLGATVGRGRIGKAH